MTLPPLLEKSHVAFDSKRMKSWKIIDLLVVLLSQHTVIVVTDCLWMLTSVDFLPWIADLDFSCHQSYSFGSHPCNLLWPSLVVYSAVSAEERLGESPSCMPLSNSFQKLSIPLNSFDLPDENAFAPPDMARDNVCRNGAKFCFNCNSRKRLCIIQLIRWRLLTRWLYYLLW